MDVIESKKTLIPIVFLILLLKIGSNSAIYSRALYFFNTLKASFVSAIDQNVPRVSNANKNIANFEISLSQMILMCSVKEPDKSTKTSVKNRNKLVKAGPNGIKKANISRHIKDAC